MEKFVSTKNCRTSQKNCKSWKRLKIKIQQLLSSTNFLHNERNPFSKINRTKQQNLENYNLQEKITKVLFWKQLCNTQNKF